MAPLTVSLVLYRPEPALLRATLAALEVASRRADLQPDLFLIDNGGTQMTWLVSIEREGAVKPVCVAESIARSYP